MHADFCLDKKKKWPHNEVRPLHSLTWRPGSQRAFQFPAFPVECGEICRFFPSGCYTSEQRGIRTSAYILLEKIVNETLLRLGESGVSPSS